MWYVIQVFTRQEEKVVRMCQRVIGTEEFEGSVLQRCFIPYTQRQRKYRGEWHIEQCPLFPGYVFLVSDAPEDLFFKLKRVPALTKILGTGWEFVPLTDEEVDLLQRLGGERQIVEASIGVIENDQIIVKRGPLVGMEGLIKKIDRHKRLAWLEVEMMGRIMEVQVSLEVVEKTTI